MDIKKPDEIKKQVAVMVVDLARITSYEGGSLPDGITGIITRFAEVCEAVVELYNGRIEHGTGEHFKIFFGLDDRTDDFSGQSIQALLEIRNRVELMSAGQEIEAALRLRAGISAGEVIIGEVGTGKVKRLTIVGNPVELAMRIQDLAESGQILVDAEVFRQTRGQFEFRALEPMHIKGQKKPVAVYELAGKKKEIKTGSAESARMITSGMVGREQEARIIEELIKQLLNGRGGVLNIEGAAGIGKSRLIAEIKTREITSNIAFFEGRALSEGRNLSFHPIIQIIKTWSGISEDDNPLVAYKKLSGNIHRIYPEQASEIVPFVATMMGFPLDVQGKQRIKGIEGEALEKLILKNVRDLLSRAATIRPVVLLVEDSHWADLSSISFMESLFKLARNHRLLFINVFRPGFKDTGEHLKAFVKENMPEHGYEIILKTLNQVESGELITNLLNQTNLPPDIRGLVITRSEGNPFFIEEVIRSFIDEGLIEVKEDRFVVTEQIQYANIPETIDKVILSRIERLDEKTKSLLRTASVIGRNFYYKVLEEAAQTIEELDSKLEYLKETQLLNESRHKEDVEFLFKHALAQQATYDSILLKTKKELHLKIARSIEKVFAEKIHEFYGILAMHYGKAEVPEKVEEYLFKAGEQSLAAGASSEAVNYFRQALDAYLDHHKSMHDRKKIADLEEKIGFAYAMKGLNLEAVDYFSRVLDFHQFRIPENKTRRLLLAIFYYFTYIITIRNPKLFLLKKPPENIDTVYRMIISKGEALATVNPKRLFIESQFIVKFFIKYGVGNSKYALGNLSSYCVFFSWFGLFFNTARRTLDLCGKMEVDNDTLQWLQYKFSKRMYDFCAGKWNDDPEMDNTVNLGLQKGAAWELTIYLLYSGFILAERGNFLKSGMIVSRLFDTSDYFENSHARAQGYRLSSLIHLKLKKPDEVIRITSEGIEFTGKTNHIAMLQVLHCHRCIARCINNEMDGALADLREAEKLVRQSKIVKIYICEYLLAKCHYEFALIKNKSTMDPFAVRHLQKQIRRLIKNSKTIPSHHMEGYRLKAILYWRMNKQRKAYVAFEKSLQQAESLGAKPELARVYFELGKCLIDPKSRRKVLNAKNGSEHLLKARSLFEELDLQWDLKEYERYMEG